MPVLREQRLLVVVTAGGGLCLIPKPVLLPLSLIPRKNKENNGCLGEDGYSQGTIAFSRSAGRHPKSVMRWRPWHRSLPPLSSLPARNGRLCLFLEGLSQKLRSHGPAQRAWNLFGVNVVWPLPWWKPLQGSLLLVGWVPNPNITNEALWSGRTGLFHLHFRAPCYFPHSHSPPSHPELLTAHGSPLLSQWCTLPLAIPTSSPDQHPLVLQVSA